MVIRKILFKDGQRGVGSGIFYVPPKSKSNGWWYEDRYYHVAYVHDNEYAKKEKNVRNWILSDQKFIQNSFVIVLKSLASMLIELRTVVRGLFYIVVVLCLGWLFYFGPFIFKRGKK